MKQVSVFSPVSSQSRTAESECDRLLCSYLVFSSCSVNAAQFILLDLKRNQTEDFDRGTSDIYSIDSSVDAYSITP